jgi:hypothetical protein
LAPEPRLEEDEREKGDGSPLQRSAAFQVPQRDDDDGEGNQADQGRNGAELEDLCVIAGAIDGGLFETAGFTFAGDTWRQGQQGCCRLKVLPGPAKA